MKKIDLGQAIQTAANLGVLAGIFFLAYEIRQNTTATQLAGSESHMSAFIGQNDLIAANPQLAAVLSRAVAGDELSPAESMQLSQLLSSRLFAWQNSYIQYSQGAISEDVMRGLDLTMHEWIRDMPAFRRFWENRMQRFAPDFVGHVNSIISSGSDD